MINSDVVKGKWKQLQGKIKQQWGHATGHHRIRVIGKRDQWIGTAQESFGYAKQKTEQAVDHLLRKTSLR